MSRIRLAAAIAAALALASCSGKSSVTDAHPGTLTGTWDIQITTFQGTFAATLGLEQNGAAVTGTTRVTGLGGPTGRFTGTVNGDQITFRLDQDPPCVGVYNGTGTISNEVRRVQGQYSGSDCSGSLSATFVANKR